MFHKAQRLTTVAAATTAVAAALLIGAAPSDAAATVCNETVLSVHDIGVRNGNETISSSAALYIQHDCRTNAQLSASMVVTTRTRTDNAFAGFHSCVSVKLGPAYWQSTVHRVGVDGTAIGTPDITLTWSESVPLSTAQSDRGGQLYLTQTFGC